MAGDLRDLMHGAAESKRQLFSSEDFVGGYGRTVVGRVKRRRAVSATAFGGGSAVAVGAIAVGAGTMPWGGFGFAGPGGQPAVLCTTVAPDAMVKPEHAIPENMAYAVVDEASGEAATVGWDGKQALAWDRHGDVWRLAGVDGHAELTFASGTVVVIWPRGDRGVEVEPAPGITVMTIEDYLRDVDLRWDFTVAVASVPGAGATWEVRLDGDAIGVITTEADQATFTFSNGDSQQLGAVDSGPQRVALPTGENLVFTFQGGEPHFVGQASSSVSPIVTCVTTTPEPSESTSPSPSASPNPAWPWDPAWALQNSPFECGFELPSESQGAENVWLGDLRWLTPQDAREEINAAYAPGAEPDLSISDDLVAAVEYGVPQEFFNGSVGSSLSDPGPEDLGPAPSEGALGQSGLGVQYVLVGDGKVVAVGNASVEGGSKIYMTGAAGGQGDMYLLAGTQAFVACEGVDPNFLPGTQLYAVAGFKTMTETGQVGPEYVWKKIESQG